MPKKITLAIAVMAAALGAEAAKQKDVTLDLLGTYETGKFDDGAAEIVSYDPVTQRVFVINAADSTVDLLDISDPASPTLSSSIDVAPDIATTFPGSESGGINSVAVKNGIVAVAVENDDKQAFGWAAFYDVYGSFLGAVEAGALPDMITFTPNGQYALVANEGEPSDDYKIDPEGSVTVIDLRGGINPGAVQTADFTSFNNAVLPEGMRAPRPFGATVAQDLEPEYIATSHDSRTAWVVLQENNAVAEIDIRSASVTQLVGLGSKDHSLAVNALDASNRDGGINIEPWPVNGLYMPDSIVAYRSRGKTYLVTANEGDGREYISDADEYDTKEKCRTAGGLDFDDGDCLFYIDEARVGDVDDDEIIQVVLDPTVFPNADTLQEDENLGRLKIVATEGDTDGDGDYDKLYSFGARSITVWDAETFVGYDTGSTIEEVTAALYPDDFNSTNDENDSFDNRSDDKGPEPETAVVGKAFGRQYAFVGLERIGGIMVFDVTQPEKEIRYVSYVNNRDFSVDDVESSEVGDLGPEGLFFIKEEDSPIGEPLLVVGNEVSGTTSIYQVERVD